MASADIALLADVRSIEHLGLWEVALTDEDLARLRSPDESANLAI